MERQEKSFAVNELFGHALSGAVGAFLVWLALFAIVDLVSGDLSPAGLFARGRLSVLLFFSYIGLISGAFLYARKVRQVKFYLLVIFFVIMLSCILGWFYVMLFVESLSIQSLVSAVGSFLALSILGVMVSFLHTFDNMMIRGVKQGDVALVQKLLLEKPSKIDIVHHGGDCLLHIAALTGQKDIVALLLSKGTDINVQNNTGRTPLHVAAQQGHKDVVELLLANGANANAKDEGGHDPLHYAKQGHHKEVEEFLALQLER